MCDEDILKVLRRAKTVIPYVCATLSAGNTFPSTDQDDWVEIHRGRAFSSNNQLKALEREIDDLLAQLESPS